MGGVRAAIEFGASLIAAGSFAIFISLAVRSVSWVRSWQRFQTRSAGIRLRVVDDDAWGIICQGEFAPRGAVALDLSGLI